MSGRMRLQGLVLVGLVSGGLACETEPTTPAKEVAEPQEVPESKPVVDSKIARAMASAAQEKPPATAGAPPPNGILGLQAANRQAPHGTAAKLDLGSSGGMPRVRLAAVDWTLAQESGGTLTLSARTAGGVMPNIDVSLSGSRPAVVSADGEAPERIRTVVELTSVRLSAQQPGRLPPSAEKSVAALNGSTVEITANRHGAVFGVKPIAKRESPDVKPMLDQVAETFATLLLPYPKQPVGPGAYWMVTSREDIGGVDAVVYRMLRVTAVTGKTAEVNIQTRRYLVEPSLSIVGLPPHTVRQFKGEGSGSFTIVEGSVFPIKAQLTESLLAMVVPSDRPQQVLPLQTEAQVSLQWGALPE